MPDARVWPHNRSDNAMNYKLLVAMAALILSTACAVPSRNWDKDHSQGLAPNEWFVRVPYDNILDKHSSGEADEFSLYYFTKDRFDPSRPSILIIPGGPGQTLNPSSDLMSGYPKEFNVVSFDFRGSGRSQFPPSNKYDAYLRTKYAVEDIEIIRRDLGIRKWFAVVGYSYGTVLAQQYVGTYGRKQRQDTHDRVETLVLIAPLSRQTATTSTGAATLAKQIRDKHVEVFRILFQNRIARDSQVDNKAERFASKLEDVISTAETKFGDLPFIINNFSRLKTFFGHDLLKDEGLDYSEAFFRAVRGLRNTGWLASDPKNITTQNFSTILISRELACSMHRPAPSTQDSLEPDYCDLLTANRDFAFERGQPSVNFILSEAKDNVFNKLRKTQLAVLSDIYDEPPFDDLRSFKDKIINKVERILSLAAAEMGGLPFIIKNYDGFKDSAEQTLLKPDGDLDYSVEFFKALDRLMYFPDGFLPEETHNIGVIVAKALENDKDLAGLEHHTKRWPQDRIEQARKFFNQPELFSKPPVWVGLNKTRMVAKLANHYGIDTAEACDQLSLHKTAAKNVVFCEITQILDRISSSFGGCLACAIKTKYSEALQGAADQYYEKELIERLYWLADYDSAGESLLQPTEAIKNFLLRWLKFSTPGHDTEVERQKANQRYIANDLGYRIACALTKRLEDDRHFYRNMPTLSEKTPSYCDVAASAYIPPFGSNSRRVYNVVSIYDGIDIGFLEKWWQTQDLKEAVRSSAGTVHVKLCGQPWYWRCRETVNEEIELVGIDHASTPEPWRPDKFEHTVPTLILAGRADPVTAGSDEVSQADHVFDQALKGHRTKILFPGIGHNLNILPGTVVNRKPACEARSVRPIAEGMTEGAWSVAQQHVPNCLITEYLTSNGNHNSSSLPETEFLITLTKLLKEINQSAEPILKIRRSQDDGQKNVK